MQGLPLGIPASRPMAPQCRASRCSSEAISAFLESPVDAQGLCPVAHTETSLRRHCRTPSHADRREHAFSGSEVLQWQHCQHRHDRPSLPAPGMPSLAAAAVSPPPCRGQPLPLLRPLSQHKRQPLQRPVLPLPRLLQLQLLRRRQPLQSAGLRVTVSMLCAAVPPPTCASSPQSHALGAAPRPALDSISVGTGCLRARHGSGSHCWASCSRPARRGHRQSRQSAHVA
mmetsp:Transcript_124799/g.216461  ORF Transcript_124799/g.216461 Transcript_124799/m.216461 type:complete len:228 (-) Transcript_124799:1391-2074(-)